MIPPRRDAPRPGRGKKSNQLVHEGRVFNSLSNNGRHPDGQSDVSLQSLLNFKLIRNSGIFPGFGQPLGICIWVEKSKVSIVYGRRYTANLTLLTRQLAIGIELRSNITELATPRVTLKRHYLPPR